MFQTLVWNGGLCVMPGTRQVSPPEAVVYLDSISVSRLPAIWSNVPNEVSCNKFGICSHDYRWLVSSRKSQITLLLSILWYRREEPNLRPADYESQKEF